MEKFKYKFILLIDMITREIGKKGQIVIPKDIRSYLGVRTGEKIVFQIKNNEVIIKSQDNKNFLEEFLNVPKLNKGIRIKELKETLDDQY